MFCGFGANLTFIIKCMIIKMKLASLSQLTSSIIGLHFFSGLTSHFCSCTARHSSSYLVSVTVRATSAHSLSGTS